ncbi:MAG: hypothetical protein ACOX52_16075 [Verrucomicrobiota bacterium]
MPRDISGGLGKLKPIATHNRMIPDYCSWRGLLVHERGPPAGGNRRAWSSGRSRGSGSVWSMICGKLGRPVGYGGPWRATQVEAGVWSDPYLMRGFDEKVLELSHDRPTAVRFRIELDVSDVGDWVHYVTFEVGPGESLVHRFPIGFMAGWIRVQASENCAATAQLRYGPQEPVVSMLEAR